MSTGTHGRSGFVRAARGRTTLTLFPLLSLLVPACASLDGLDDGNGRDAGASHPPGHDATIAHEASPGGADAQPDTATSADAPRAHDASHGDVRDAPAQKEASPTSDAGADANDAAPSGDASTDAPEEAACVPVPIPDSGPPPACPGPDAAACAPRYAANFTPAWIPPAAPRSVCTNAQIKNLMDSCFGAGATQAACQAILDSTADEPCNSCMLTQSTDSTWGPLVFYASYGFYALNTGGCIALTAPCQSACAAAYEAAEECQLEACAAACPLTGTGYTACAVNANSCGCYGWANAQITCGDELIVGPPALCILNDTEAGFEAEAELYGSLFCVGPQDAETDGGSLDAAPHD